MRIPFSVCPPALKILPALFLSAEASGWSTTATTPQLYSLRVLHRVVPIPFITDNTTNALIRISRVIDKSYGSGSTDDLVQYASTPVELDSLVQLDKVSSNGTFYLTIVKQKHQLKINENCSLEVHNKILFSHPLPTFTDFIIVHCSVLAGIH